MNNTQDYEAVALIHSDEYALTYRGRRAHTLAGQSEEVLIQQWINPHLFTDDCRQREDLYAYVSKKSPNLARLIVSDFKHGRYVYETFSCSLAQYNRFLEDGSPVWEQTWRDAIAALYQLHTSYLNHGNLTVNSFYFRKDGQLKIVGIFPNFNDDFKYNVYSAPEGREFLEQEFKKDIVALCSIFLSEPYRHLIPQADQDDCAKLSKGELTLENAVQLAQKRFNEIVKLREDKDIKARKRALLEKENLEKQYRKGPGFIFMSIVCIQIILGVIGVKYAFDRIKSENTPTNTSISSKQQFEQDLQIEAEKKRKQALGGADADYPKPPDVGAQPRIQTFIGTVTNIAGTNIEARNQMLVSLKIYIDNETKIMYADGSPRRQTEIRKGQEIEVEYELTNADKIVYAHIITIQSKNEQTTRVEP